MMNNKPQVFNYQDSDIRVVIQNSEPWFVAADVCKVLGFGNSRQALATHIDDDEKDVQILDSPGGMQSMTIINESGLYTLILRSNKPNARKFRKWITSIVIPSIRRFGFYSTPDTAQHILEDPDTFIEILKAYKETKALNTALAAKIELDKPKVIFTDAVSASKDSILVGSLAKILKQNGVDMGQNKLFNWLRNNGYLISHGERHNMPTQKSMEMGLFEVKTSVINNPDGSTRVTRTTKVTGKGQVYFVNKFLKGEHVCKFEQEAE